MSKKFKADKILPQIAMKVATPAVRVAVTTCTIFTVSNNIKLLT
jgi:hypothetical protein